MNYPAATVLAGRSRRRFGRVAVTAVLVLVSSFLGWAAFSHDVSYVVTNGVSMHPLYTAGDLVVTRKQLSYGVGQAVAYHDTTNHLVVLHRIVGGDPVNGFEVKGDNNDSVDQFHPTNAQIIGRAALDIPAGGIWLRRITSLPVAGTLLFLLLAGGGGALESRRRSRRVGLPRQPGRRRIATGSATSATTWSPEVQTAASVAAALGLLAIGLGAFAWTTPTTQQETTEGKSTRSMTFGYSTHVRDSAAYDDTTVTSPDPVFRTLSNAVDVRFAYQGKPGRIAVDAEISTVGGWHTTLPLAAERSFTESRYAGVVRLHLRQLEQRAAAAAEVTKIPAGVITITVVPRVIADTGTIFAPALRLTLTPLVLALADSSTALTVTRSSTIHHITHGPRSWILLNHQIKVSVARTLSVVLAGAALLALLTLVLIARVAGRTDAATRARRRSRPLLVGVAPLQLQPGHTLVDVTDLATLNRLAEQYGSLIMHWAAAGRENFVVLDQSTAYRYRSVPQVAASTGPSHPAQDLADAGARTAEMMQEWSDTVRPQLPSPRATPDSSSGPPCWPTAASELEAAAF
jgi:signal peptidase I